MNSAETQLTTAQYQEIARMAYRICGINLFTGKEELVKSRLVKRLRELGLSDFRGYLEYLGKDGSCKELSMMITCLTTNTTHFFRENGHFEFMTAKVLPGLRNRPIRIWSAGCSTGEEPYSIAMSIQETLGISGHHDSKILATDISNKVLDRARHALYDDKMLQELPAGFLQKYFSCVKCDRPRTYAVKDSMKDMVTFAKLNLMDDWPMKGGFDIIFCRNVLIYFDKDTQKGLVRRFHDMLAHGGYLFLGHSESMAGADCGFKYVMPAIYLKN